MLGLLADFDAIDAGAGRRFPDVSKTFWGFYDIVEANILTPSTANCFNE